MLHVVPVTVAVPITTPSRSTSTTSPAPSAPDSVPETAGAVSLVLPPLDTTPCAGSTSSLTAVMVTAAVGAWVSTVRVTGPESAPTLPASSVAVTVIVWSPSVSGVSGVNVQVPSSSTVTEPITSSPS